MSVPPPSMDRVAASNWADQDFSMPDNPFANDVFLNSQPEDDYTPEDDPFVPFRTAELPRSDEPTPSLTSDDGWGWHDAGLIAVERTDETGNVIEYAVGVVDLYANVHTGDLGGSYLEIGSFEDIRDAADYYHELQGEIHDRMLLPFHLVDFADEKALERADERGKPAPVWVSAGPAEYAAYEEARSLYELDTPDLLAEELSFVPPSGGEAKSEHTEATLETPTFKALREIGIAADGFDPATDPPPFVDPDTGTAYWIGVFQPDRDDPTNCVTSILSLGRDSNTGQIEAQLAPCVPGDWDKSYSAAKYLLNMVEKGGIDRCFEAAEGMALASDQRELWEAERGIPLEPDAAHDLADYTRDQWEINL